MGKKSRVVPGRRPILQLSPPGPRSSTPGRDPEPEPDTEPDSTAATPSQPAPAAPTSTTTAVTAAAAPEDSPSEGKGARGARPLGGASENRARGWRPSPSGRALGGRETWAGGVCIRGLLRGACGEDRCGPQGDGRAAEPCARVPEAPSLVQRLARHPEPPQRPRLVVDNLRG